MTWFSEFFAVLFGEVPRVRQKHDVGGWTRRCADPPKQTDPRENDPFSITTRLVRVQESLSFRAAIISTALSALFMFRLRLVKGLPVQAPPPPVGSSSHSV